jgi:hypothetical protein
MADDGVVSADDVVVIVGVGLVVSGSGSVVVTDGVAVEVLADVTAGVVTLEGAGCGEVDAPEVQLNSTGNNIMDMTNRYHFMPTSLQEQVPGAGCYFRAKHIIGGK